MPLYIYKAVDPHNRIEQGSLTAKNPKEAAEAIKKMALSPLSIKPEAHTITIAGKVPAIEKITFVHYLSTMLKAGISLSEGMPILLNETKHPLMKKLISDVIYGLSQGQQLSSLFSKYPRIFDRVFITLTKSGEISGTLGDTFSYLEDQLRSEYSLSQKIKGALLYPGIVFIAMLAIANLMFFFILPQIAKVFLNMKIPLPRPTEILFELSLKAANYKLLIIAAIIGLIISFFIFLKSSLGKKIVFTIISPVPVVKNILKQADLARFTRIFSTLMKSAVPIAEALEISLSTLSWAQFRNVETVISQQIKKGKSIAEAFKTNPNFPGLLTQMIAAGEKSGTLDQTMSDLATFYEGEVEESVKKATQLLEPMLMLLVGIGVGAVILSIISPLYSVVGNLQNVR